MMLNDAILLLILGFLTLSVALNFWLTFRLIHTVRTLPIPSGTKAMPVGTAISEVPMTRFVDKQPDSLGNHPNEAKVLVFLNSKCDKCKAKLPELRATIGKTANQGVIIRIVSMEKRWRLKRFLQDEVLLNATLRTRQPSYYYLNPQNASPFYMFIDAENTLQASGMIGDENWGNFIAQLDEEG